MKSLVVYVILLISACESYKILVLLPYPGKSHYMVFEPILEELTRRGHQLTVVSFYPLNTPNKNRRDVSLVGLTPLSIEVVDLKTYENINGIPGQKYFSQFATISRLANEGIKLCEKLLNADVFEEFVKAQGDYDVILLEHFNSDCMLGIVHNYGLPSIGLITCTMLPWTAAWVGGDDNPATYPSTLLPFTSKMTFVEQIINSLDLLYYKYWHQYISSKYQNLLESKLGHTLPLMEEIGKNASVVLINTYYPLNGVKVLPPSVIEIGGIHLHNRSVRPLPDALHRWVTQAEHGVILVSFGSLIRSSTLPPKRLTAMLRVFSRLKQRVVWKWEAEHLTNNNVPENVLVMKWIPQYDLLNHPNCVGFITHGGLLSLTEIVSTGVPALIMPILGDQPGNAAHAKQVGIAEYLDFQEINEENLYEALSKILLPQIRIRAKEFSKLWKDRLVSPMATAVYHIEKTARYGNLNMSSQARLLSEPHLLFFNSIFYIFVFGLLFMVYTCCYFCCLTKKVKVKQS